MNFSTAKKKTFLALDGYTEIERNGKPFYKASNSGEPFLFNLPKGNYFIIDGEIVEQNENLDFAVGLPEKQRNGRVPRLSVSYKPTRFKAHIFRDRGKIVIDPQYLKHPDYVRSFLKWHEVGHYYYKDEIPADLWSANKMLKLGYNPSQIYSAIATIFKDKPEEMEERIETIKKNLSKNEITSKRY